MTPEKFAEAERLADAGWKYREIAEHLGVSVTTAYRWANPHARDYDKKASNGWRARNQERKKAYDREYREENKRVCVECGEQKLNCQAREDTCKDCLQTIAHFKRSLIEEMWLAGKTYPEIQQTMGYSKGHLAVEMDRMRKLGYDLPHRYTRGKRAGRTYPQQKAAA